MCENLLDPVVLKQGKGHKLANFKQRLRALEKHVAETGAVLTEAQVVAREVKWADDIPCGEIETAHPGYLSSQDTLNG